MRALLQLLQYIILGSILVLLPKVSAAEISITINSSTAAPLANIIVYLEPLDGQPIKQPSSEALTVYQSAQKFAPYISVIQKGRKLNFVNKDNITHQIYSTSSDNRFSFRVSKNAEQAIAPLQKTGKVLMGCNIHDWMSGYLLVVDTQYFSMTNDDGQATITINNNGRYQLTIWHPQIQDDKSSLTREIMISDGNNQQFQLSNKMQEIPSQENPDSFDFIDDY